MRDFLFWQRWLIAVAVLIAVFGVSIALLNETELFDLFSDQINPVFWDTKSVDTNAHDFQHWVYGVLGATVAGWGVFLAFVAHYPFKRKEPWAWNCVAAGMAVWFVVDSYISLSVGNYFNELAVNVPLLVLVMLPLWFTRHEFV